MTDDVKTSTVTTNFEPKKSGSGNAVAGAFLGGISGVVIVIVVLILMVLFCCCACVGLGMLSPSSSNYNGIRVASYPGYTEHGADPAPTTPTTPTTPANPETPATPVTPTPPAVTITVSQKNALAKAESYLKHSAFSHDGLVGQLEYEEFSHEDAVYAADNCGADWNEQAAKKAQSYMSHTAFSRGGLINQLKYEKFTQTQAEYGASSVGL